MKIAFALTDENGRRFVGEAELIPEKTKFEPDRTRPHIDRASAPVQLSLNTRAFIKRYARGLSGAQKFTLLLARLAKGDISKEVSLGEIRDQWNRMKGLMGGPFNAAHTVRAKENGWADTKKHGVYVLDRSWKQALNRE